MKSLSATRTKRNWAIAMLLLWVFAIANACVFDPLSMGVRLAAGDASINSAGGAASASTVKTDYFASSASHGIRSENSGGPCLDVADFGPNSVISIEADAGFDPLNVLPSAVTQLTVAKPIDLVQRPIDDQRPLETAIPLRVRYVRLAL